MNNFLKRNEIDFVFVDWFGVISSKLYWCEQYQLDSRIKQWWIKNFSNRQVLEDWMRGKISLSQMAYTDAGCNYDYVINSFEKDRKYYSPDWQILRSIASIFPAAKRVLITDNMCLFRDKIVPWNPALKTFFDKIYVSAEHGSLKVDRPYSLFHFALKDLGLENYQRCLLVDDCEENCRLFRDLGGRTILIS